MHYLLQAERCPRSAALRYAKYANLWRKKGYPGRPSIAASSGTVIHIATNRIASKFAENGCSSSADPRCFSILKDLGGYSSVVSGAIDDIVAAFADNPRFEALREPFVTALRNRAPALREGVQSHLSRISWTTKLEAQALPEETEDAKTTSRYPLEQGFHFEVEVRDLSLKWKGVIDFIELRANECAITEFKNGAPADDHVLQLQVYALLWMHDVELNPEAIPISTLRLLYPTHEQNVAFSSEDKAGLYQSLLVRTAKVRAAIQGPSSRANLSADFCPHCDVRHLCSDYWTINRPVPAQPGQAKTFNTDDVQAVLKERRSDNTWLAESQIANRFAPRTQFLLKWASPYFKALGSLEPGKVIRAAGAMLSYRDEYPLVTCTASTDLLVLQL